MNITEHEECAIAKQMLTQFAQINGTRTVSFPSLPVQTTLRSRDSEPSARERACACVCGGGAGGRTPQTQISSRCCAIHVKV
jgi:hypothetical protein